MSESQNNIPDFLAQTGTNDDTNAPIVKSSAYGVRPMLAVVCGVWVVLLFTYIHFIFGWADLTALMPLEFVCFLAFAFLTPVVLAFLISRTFRAVASADQAAMVSQSLNKILFADRKNALSMLLDQDLRDKIGVLGSTVRLLSDQTQNLKKELDVRAEDFSKVGAVLEKNLTENLQKLGGEMTSFSEQCQSALDLSEKVSDTLAVRADELRTNATAASEVLNPLINETVASAEHFENILQNNKNYIEQANSALSAFCDTNRRHLENALEMLNQKETAIEQSFLKTADSCEEIFKRLDSSISHIENSIRTHQNVSAEQSALLEKNSTYLDGKLGEYGRLISMEVEEMVKRSSTLEMNVQKQIEELSTARQKTDEILDGVNHSLEQKSGAAVQAIGQIVTDLDRELSKLAEFIKKTERQNQDVEESAEKITQKIGAISDDLGLRIDELKTRSVEALDRFNEVSGNVRTNTAQLSEATHVLTAQGRESNAFLIKQNADIATAGEELKNVLNGFSEIGRMLENSTGSASQVFSEYKKHMQEFDSLITAQVERLNKTRQTAEARLNETKEQYAKLELGGFLDVSNAVIQDLGNMSVNISSIFGKDDDEALWKKFYGGDLMAFARHTVKNMTRKQILRIREEYENNAEFRTLADRYLNEFETLLSSVKQTDKPQLMMALFSDSDLGKIYYIMARALDRLD